MDVFEAIEDALLLWIPLTGAINLLVVVSIRIILRMCRKCKRATEDVNNEATEKAWKVTEMHSRYNRLMIYLILPLVLKKDLHVFQFTNDNKFHVITQVLFYSLILKIFSVADPGEGQGAMAPLTSISNQKLTHKWQF